MSAAFDHMDLKQETNVEQQQTSEEKNNSNSNSNSNSNNNNSSSSSSPLKGCTGCCTTKTPLWRSGPEGPKSLCNACGIKYNKKRRKGLGSEVVNKEKKKKNESDQSSEVTEILNTQFMPSEKNEELMSKLGEEERAAILLMNLSGGSVNA